MSDEYRAEKVLGVPRVTEFPTQHDLPQRRAYHAYDSAQREPPLEHSIHDVASVLGLSADAVSAEVLEAVKPLLVELDRLRSHAERAERARAYLEREADRHAFLPCLNRRAFLRDLDMRIAAREGASTVAVLHVAGVESLRQAYGLAAADAALRHACAIILGSLRASDALGALGGSDFGLVLAGADGAAAATKVAGLREAVETFFWYGERGALGLRFGVHTVGAGEDAAQAIDAADRALRGEGDAVRR